MKKILILGAKSHDDINEKIKEIKSILNEEVEIVLADDIDEQISIMFDHVVNLKSIELHAPPLLEAPFVPKAKHQPKPHERPYKYHR